MLKLFSTHIVAKHFDPTADVIPQLQALDVRQPHPSLPYGEVEKRIAKMMSAITLRDNELRKNGIFCCSCTLDVRTI